jgi:hypothetical protein
MIEAVRSLLQQPSAPNNNCRMARKSQGAGARKVRLSVGWKNQGCKGAERWSTDIKIGSGRITGAEKAKGACVEGGRFIMKTLRAESNK